MSELRECPFCGGEDIEFRYIRDGLNISCSDCSASKHKYLGKYDIRKELIKAWNTRADDGQHNKGIKK